MGVGCIPFDSRLEDAREPPDELSGTLLVVAHPENRGGSWRNSRIAIPPRCRDLMRAAGLYLGQWRTAMPFPPRLVERFEIQNRRST